MQIEQLSRTQHAGLRIDPRRAEAAAASVHFVPLVRQELRAAALCYPVLFAKSADTGRFYPGALMGLSSGENLFWDGNRVEADYIPLNIQRLPFYVGEGSDAGEVICIDTQSPGIVAEGPYPIVEADGADSDYFRHIQAILGQMMEQREPTAAFVDMLTRLELLTEMQLMITLNNGEEIEVSGLYAIDERALEARENDIGTFEDRLVCGSLVLSVGHIAGLVRRKNDQAEQMAGWLEPVEQ